MAATAGNQTYPFNGKDRTFGLLSVEDLMTITASIPNPSGEPINLSALDKWSKNPQGCEHFLYLAAQKVTPLVKVEEIRTWGSILRRINVAADLLTKSLLNGEEEEVPKAEGAQPPATGG